MPDSLGLWQRHYPTAEQNDEPPVFPVTSYLTTASQPSSCQTPGVPAPGQARWHVRLGGHDAGTMDAGGAELAPTTVPGEQLREGSQFPPKYVAQAVVTC